MTGLLETLDALDRDLFRWANGGLHRLGSEALDGALQCFNQLGNAWTLVPVLGALLAFARPGRVLLRRALEVGLAQAAVALLVRWSKGAIARPRPFATLVDAFRDGTLVQSFGESGRKGSLPSGHAATAFAFAVVLSAWAGRLPRGPRRAVLRGLPFVLASLTGVARVYAGMHYPGDVVAGAALGAAVAWVGLRASRLVGGDDRPGAPLGAPAP